MVPIKALLISASTVPLPMVQLVPSCCYFYVGVTSAIVPIVWRICCCIRVRNAISAHDVELQEQISSLGCKSMGRSICLWENPEHVYI